MICFYIKWEKCLYYIQQLTLDEVCIPSLKKTGVAVVVNRSSYQSLFNNSIRLRQFIVSEYLCNIS
jgi:hypothetical protein